MVSSLRPVIATDVDGVLLSWQSGLPYFAQKYNLPLEHILEMIQDDKFIAPGQLFGCDDDLAKQLIEKYNCSDFIRYLAPYIDALRQVNKLKKAYDFVAVTALGDSIDARLNRQFNLNALFPGAFKDVYMCGHSESKELILTKVRLKYGERIKFYVDDLAHHCDAASRILDCPVYWMPRGERDVASEKGTKVLDWDNLVAIQLKREEVTINEERFKTAMDNILSRSSVVPNQWNNRIGENELRAYYRDFPTEGL